MKLLIEIPDLEKDQFILGIDVLVGDNSPKAKKRELTLKAVIHQEVKFEKKRWISL